jgi:hypothetical protein
MLTTDRWKTDPRQFWLRAGAPPEPVRFDGDAGIWHVCGYPEAQCVLADTPDDGYDEATAPPPLSRWPQG